ncbi:C-X-C motif chemokine 6-like [Morone saxatilis]|uniref:C-X-C motif chemokine 6-like n=1 Tax=Morone saxatilis TaxID=34816 RepID=UPI0015E23365|nr:C-X-C motif chemokine 6-like [Morone saxatilis]
MSGIMKVFLLLAVMVCISKAQLRETGQQCLCQRVRGPVGLKSEIKDLQVYQATIFCQKVEIVVTLKSGFRYCLNPKLNAVKKVLANIIAKQKTTTTRPTEFTSTSTSPGSTNTARN